MFQERGLSMTQISLLIMIWSGAVVLLEIPTGILADKFSRKSLLILSKLIKALTFIFWLGQNFSFYAVGFVLWSLAGALHSGTYLAFVYDELKKQKCVEKYELISGRIKMLGHIAVAISLAIGGFISQYSYTVALILSSLAAFTTMLISFTFPEAKAVKSTKEKKYLIFLQDALKEAKKDKVLLRLIILFVIAFGFYGSYDEFSAIVIKNFGLSISQVGLIFSASYIAFALAGLLSPYLSKISKLFDNLSFLVFSAGLLFLLVGIKTVPVFLIFIILAEFLLGVTEVKTEVCIQHQIDSPKRATLLSLNSLGRESIAVIAVLIMGFVSENVGVESILYLVGLALIFTSISFYFTARSNKFWKKVL
jgi:predicted MFS family arabinose efflux permease